MKATFSLAAAPQVTRLICFSIRPDFHSPLCINLTNADNNRIVTTVRFRQALRGEAGCDAGRPQASDPVTAARAQGGSQGTSQEHGNVAEPGADSPVPGEARRRRQVNAGAKSFGSAIGRAGRARRTRRRSRDNH